MNTWLNLKDKIIIVTGGASGIGLAIVDELLAQGANVQMSDIHGGDKYQNRDNYNFWPTDISSASEVNKTVESIIQRFGRIDGVVNNAGANYNVGLDASVDAFRASLETNLIHYFSMVHHALPHLKQSRGSIVNIGSKTAVTGQGQTSGYCAANGGRLALTREWAAALLSDGIRVNAVCPGFIATDILNTMPDKVLDGFRSACWQRRLGLPGEVANVYTFLASDDASFVNGTALEVSGGLSI